MNDCAPWAEFGDDDEIRDTRQSGGFVFGGEGDVAVSGFAIESSSRTCRTSTG